MAIDKKIEGLLFNLRVGINEYFTKKYGTKVIRGPFEGASLCESPRWGRTDRITMMLGQYELEIQESVQTAFENADIFVDIGCGDGYYLAAASRYDNLKKIVGFDEANVAKVNSQEVLDINEVVGTIGHTARLSDLGDILSEARLAGCRSPFIMIDIEGAEFELLSDNIEILKNCVLIIETHDFSESQAKFYGLISNLECWFELNVVSPGPRNPFAFDELNCFDTNIKWLAMSEGRTLGNKWVVCTPKSYAARNTFSDIYKKNGWGSKESISGEGSELGYTQRLREWLTPALARYEINRIVDAPCGDLNWMSRVINEFNGYYIGLDIVDSLIDANEKKYGNSQISFQCKDICRDPIPAGDLIIVRDCLFHLSYDAINRFLENLAKTEYRFLLTTSHLGDVKNTDIPTGGFRLIDLFSAPFSFEPENVVERVLDFPDGYKIPREMILVEKKDVPVFLNF
jgi:SAM-dependent methyltransferase